MTPQTVALQASLSMGFSKQEYWSGLPFPSPEDLPNPGIEPGSPSLQADSLLFELQGNPKNTACPTVSGSGADSRAESTRLLVLASVVLSFPGDSDGKESACNEGDPGWIPRSGRSPGDGNGNLL